VEKYRPNAKNTVNRGRFRKCEKNFLAAREKNFQPERLEKKPFPALLSKIKNTRLLT
jgi:hypothetical protein